MDGRVSRLAARFRKAVLDRDEARKQAEDDARRAAEEARAARARLFTDLVVLAREIGVLRVEPEEGGLTLRFGERYLHFAAEGDGDRVRIEFEGMGDEEHALYRQAELGGRWVHHRRRNLSGKLRAAGAPPGLHRDDRVPFFDVGLEDLLVRGLGMPKPGDDEPEPPGPGSRKL